MTVIYLEVLVMYLEVIYRKGTLLRRWVTALQRTGEEA